MADKAVISLSTGPEDAEKVTVAFMSLRRWRVLPHRYDDLVDGSAFGHLPQ